jgi:hypothetical protein
MNPPPPHIDDEQDTLEEVHTRESGRPPGHDEPGDLFNVADCEACAAALDLAANEHGYWNPAKGARLRQLAQAFRDRAGVLVRLEAE